MFLHPLSLSDTTHLPEYPPFVIFKAWATSLP